MDQTVVKATLGRKQGSRPSRRLRAEGQLPGVVYGLDRDPQPVAVAYTELRDALKGKAGMNTVFTLDIEGSSETVLVRSLQRDPIKRAVTHADFLRVDPAKPVSVKVPVLLVGEPKAVFEVGGMIEQKRFELQLNVSPVAIPEHIEVDVSEMTIENRIAVSDLQLPDGCTTDVPENISIVAPVFSRAAKMAASGEGEDGELLEGEEGEEGAGGDDSAAGADEEASE